MDLAPHQRNSGHWHFRQAKIGSCGRLLVTCPKHDYSATSISFTLSVLAPLAGAHLLQLPRNDHMDGTSALSWNTRSVEIATNSKHAFAVLALITATATTTTSAFGSFSFVRWMENVCIANFIVNQANSKTRTTETSANKKNQNTQNGKWKHVLHVGIKKREESFLYEIGTQTHTHTTRRFTKIKTKKIEYKQRIRY